MCADELGLSTECEVRLGIVRGLETRTEDGES